MHNPNNFPQSKYPDYDGFFDFELREDGLYLILHGPMGKGKPVGIEEIITRLRQKNVNNYDFTKIKQAVKDVNNLEKLEILISDQVELEPLDEEVHVNISKDKMFAVITFIPPENNGKLLTYEEVIYEIESAGVNFGIDTDEVKRALNERKNNYKYVIAKGLKPIEGKHGKLEFHFNTNKDIKPKVLEDGSVDFRNLDLINNVSKGQTLVTLIPAQPGTPGKDVLGKEILPAKVKNPALPKGKNTEISEDGMTLISTIDGQASLINNKVTVNQTYEVPHNVDHSIGNIDFVGNVVVKGNILTGFSIKAGGNVEVYGVVEGANIEAQGDIVLYRGIQGMSKGILKSMGNVVAKYIENSTVETIGNITSEAIMHSKIKCGGSVIVEGKKGLIVGGIIRAGKEVNAKVIGSHMATSTEIEVGIDPTIVERYRQLKDELSNVKKEIIKTNQAIDLLNKLQEANKLTDAKREMLLKSIRTKVFLNDRLKSIKNEITELEPLMEERDDGRVRVFNIIHPGVKVTIGTASMYIREEIKYCTLYKDNADIRTSSYS